MKRWIKITALSLALLNLLMLVASIIPMPFIIPASELAFAGNDGSGPFQDQTSDLPESCKKIKNCHGLLGCLKRVLECLSDLIP